MNRKIVEETLPIFNPEAEERARNRRNRIIWIIVFLIIGGIVAFAFWKKAEKDRAKEARQKQTSLWYQELQKAEVSRPRLFYLPRLPVGLTKSKFCFILTS